MSDEALSLLIDVLLTVVAVAATVIQLSRRRREAVTPTNPASSVTEVVLTAAGLLVAAIGPNLLVVATTPGMPEMPLLTRYALLPSLVLLIIVSIAAAVLRLDRLTNRIAVGLWAGAAATGMLDAVRLTGFHLGYMPGNMPRMFGVMILDQMALGPTLTSDLIGYLYHYWVGACFGLAFTLILGRVRWWAGLVWGLIIEIGMMVTPPMVVAMDTGYFGVKFGPGLFVTSFLAHVAFGISLGALAARYLRHQGTLLDFVSAAWSRRRVGILRVFPNEQLR